MSVIGPAVLLLGTPGVDYGDYLSQIVQNPPAPIVFEGINRDYSSSPTRGYNITLTSIQEDLTDGTLWRYFWDNFDEQDVPIVWSPAGDDDVYFEGVIASIPDPTVGGQANQHGSFDMTLTLKNRPTIIAAPTVGAADEFRDEAARNAREVVAGFDGSLEAEEEPAA